MKTVLRNGAKNPWAGLFAALGSLAGADHAGLIPGLPQGLPTAIVALVTAVLGILRELGILGKRK